jgi:nucleotide-binding universal stress UspA family protein
VVPIDLSPLSIGALDEAIEMVESASQIHVVYVLQDAVALAPEFALGMLDFQMQVRETTESLYDRFSDKKYRGIKVHVCHGDPGIEIAKYAEEIKANLIVMPSHGRRGLTRLLIGSVAERVVRLAHCPVLVLRT